MFQYCNALCCEDIGQRLRHIISLTSLSSVSLRVSMHVAKDSMLSEGFRSLPQPAEAAAQPAASVYYSIFRVRAQV